MGAVGLSLLGTPQPLPTHDGITPDLLAPHRGGMQYKPPAWVAVHALRRVGCVRVSSARRTPVLRADSDVVEHRCKLPIEMWFAMDDMPDQGACLALPLFIISLLPPAFRRHALVQGSLTRCASWAWPCATWRRSAWAAARHR